ncbi:uncharacterized protein LOC135941959 [Cloeon dipterum]|uniref:DUF4817 domain-containing protein n=1 Tax=Cloeon dipterum TaxID=197152 RepID=A0A8S1CYL5_9INSE|nr:Hypothetical predicted protein [Cloeon dipterum]
MTTPVEKAKCVLWLESTQSVSTVQRRYQAQYGKTPPSRACVYAWYKKFSETGCLCPKSTASRPGSVSDETVEKVRSAFAASPDMSTRRASRELGVPPATITKIMRSNTHREPRIRRYRYQIGRDLDDDPLKRLLFIKEIPAPIDAWLEKVVFSGEMSFFLSGEVSRKELCIFGSDKSQDVSDIEEPESDKLTVFCAISRAKVFGPFFLTDDAPEFFYQRLFEESLLPQLSRDGLPEGAYLQVDLPLSRFSDGLRNLLDTRLSDHWIGPVSDSMPPWPQRSPEMSPLDFFLWGFVHDYVYDSGPVASVAELRHRIARAVSSVPESLLAQAWDKLNAQYEACKRNRGHRPE